MKNYILYNPLAGHGVSTDDFLPKLTDVLTPSDEIISMLDIKSYADFVLKLEKDDIIIICGGDGTLNRFVNDTRGIEIENEILYFPVGTGNDFSRDIDTESTECAFSVKKYISSLPSVEVDGKEYKFINGVGFGVDGYCCEVGDKMKAEGKTDINYTAIAIKGLLFHYKPANAVVTVDGVKHEFKKVWIAPTMNGKYYGGGMMPTPNQERLSGKLTLCVLYGTGKLKTLMLFPSIFKGELEKYDKAVSVLCGDEITVEFDRPCALQIDGETILGVTSYTAKSAKALAKIN